MPLSVYHIKNRLSTLLSTVCGTIFVPFFMQKKSCPKDSLSENEKVKQNNNSQNDTIPSENLKVMPFDISHQETDHKDRYNKSNKHAYKQKQQFRYSKCKAEFHQFQQAGTEHYRNGQKESEFSSNRTAYSDQKSGSSTVENQ